MHKKRREKYTHAEIAPISDTEFLEEKLIEALEVITLLKRKMKKMNKEIKSTKKEIERLSKEQTTQGGKINGLAFHANADSSIYKYRTNVVSNWKSQKNNLCELESRGISDEKLTDKMLFDGADYSFNFY